MAGRGLDTILCVRGGELDNKGSKRAFGINFARHLASIYPASRQGVLTAGVHVGQPMSGDQHSLDRNTDNGTFGIRPRFGHLATELAQLARHFKNSYPFSQHSTFVYILTKLKMEIQR